MLALENIKVLDLAHLAPGSYCTMILGDLGAEVIKCEALPGVGGRGAGMGISPGPDPEGRRRAAFDALNRNKKSIGFNLRSEQGREVFYKLAKTADVIVEGFRPGAVKRLGVGYDDIKKINPGIVYCSLSGFGQDGPYSQLPGHDINYISMAGVLGMIGEADRPPVAPLNLVGDFAGASLQGVIGILAALLAREKTGKGQFVDISYTDGSLSLITMFAAMYYRDGVKMDRGTTAIQCGYPYYGVYKCKDGGYISLGTLEPWFWENLCRAIGKEEYIGDHVMPDHMFTEPKGDRWQKIRADVAGILMTKTRDEWFDILTKHDVPIGKVYDLDEISDDPQIKHRQMVVEIDDPKVGKVKQTGIAIKLSDTPGKIRSLAPLFAEHSEEILLGLGYDKKQIDELRQAQAIG